MGITPWQILLRGAAREAWNGPHTELADIWQFLESGADSPDVWRIPATRSPSTGRLNRRPKLMASNQGTPTQADGSS